MSIHFSNYFEVDQRILENCGVFDISLVADLPLFIDPFLLFNSKKNEYQILHKEIIKYLLFLKEKADQGNVDQGKLKAWYTFSEVSQNWFGYSTVGNKGRALGIGFAKDLNKNLHLIFPKPDNGSVTKSVHLEKIYLVSDGVGKDNISDLTTNLIKGFLLEKTQSFAKKYVDKSKRCLFRVQKIRFSYQTETWEDGVFDLPKFKKDFVILTPKDILTKDDIWINKTDILKDFEQIPNSIGNDHLRFQINNYYRKCLSKYQERGVTIKKRERNIAMRETIIEFPQLMDYYIKYKEDTGGTAERISKEKVNYLEEIYTKNSKFLSESLKKLGFYQPISGSYEEAKRRILTLKKFIENNDGYKLFYLGGEPIGRESDLHLLFRLVCYESPFDVNGEVNNGRGAVDFSLSKGRKDKTLVEFKLAKNPKLKQNLQKQTEIYKLANRTNLAFIVILFFSDKEYKRVTEILEYLKIDKDENIILIDAINNKLSASVV